MRWLYGDEVREVYAVSRCGVLKGLGVDTPDFYTVILQFENGGVAHLEHSWLLSASTGNIFDLKCELQGSRGTVFIDTSGNRCIEKYTERTPEGYPYVPFQDVMLMPQIHGRQVGFATESIRHFVDCLWEGREPMVSAIDGLRSTEILEGRGAIGECGQPVRVVRLQVYHRLRSEAEVLEELPGGRRFAEAVDVRPLRPRARRTCASRRSPRLPPPPAARPRQHRVAISSVLPVEQVGGRHGHHPRRDALPASELLRRHRERHFRAGSDDDRRALPALRHST